MPETSEICQITGEYITACKHAVRATHKRGNELPPCPKGREAVNWALLAAS